MLEYLQKISRFRALAQISLRVCVGVCATEDTWNTRSVMTRTTPRTCTLEQIDFG